MTFNEDIRSLNFAALEAARQEYLKRPSRALREEIERYRVAIWACR